MLGSVNFQHSVATIKTSEKQWPPGCHTSKVSPTWCAEASGEIWDFCISTLLPAWNGIYVLTLYTISHFMLIHVIVPTQKVEALTHQLPKLNKTKQNKQKNDSLKSEFFEDWKYPFKLQDWSDPTPLVVKKRRAQTGQHCTTWWSHQKLAQKQAEFSAQCRTFSSTLFKSVLWHTPPCGAFVCARSACPQCSRPCHSTGTGAPWCPSGAWGGSDSGSVWGRIDHTGCRCRACPWCVSPVSTQHNQLTKAMLHKATATSSTTGFIQKNPFKIHKFFTNFCNMARKSNMKVHNSSTHLVKGRNPYYSRWPTHSMLSVKTDRKCVLFHFTRQFFFNYCLILGNAVSDW